MIDRLNAYEAVASCETYKHLAGIIRTISIEGRIQGRNRSFVSEKMALACEDFETFMENGLPNVLTREFGIRQQALYIYYSENN